MRHKATLRDELPVMGDLRKLEELGFEGMNTGHESSICRFVLKYCWVFHLTRNVTAVA